MNKKKFSYVIGEVYEDGSVCTYRIHNNDIFYGNMKHSKKTLNYVRNQYDDVLSKEEWKIFELKEVEESGSVAENISATKAVSENKKLAAKIKDQQKEIEYYKSKLLNQNY